MYLYKDLMLAFLLLCKSVNNYEREQRIILINSNEICPVVDIKMHT